MAKDRKHPKYFEQRPARLSYSELRLSIEARAGEPGRIDYAQADQVHRFWKSLGKKIGHGPAVKIK